MNLRAVITAVATVTVSLTAMAQHYESPEAALSEYVAAYKARDVERFISSIDFNYEAEELLRRVAGKTQEPTEPQVQEKANALVNELREHFAKLGFRAATLDNCKSITKFQESESQVRIILSCSDSRGTTTFPVRVHRFKHGWRIVRGG